MAITVDCPHCQGQFNVRDDFAGRKGRCPSCGGVVQAPDAPTSAPAPRRPAPRPVAESADELPPSPVPAPAINAAPISTAASSGFPLNVDESSVAMRAGGGRRASSSSSSRSSKAKGPVWPYVALGVSVPLVICLIAAVVILSNSRNTPVAQSTSNPAGGAAATSTGEGPTTVADTKFDEPVMADSVDQIKATMVKIITPVDEYSAILGAGFIIDRRGWVATNYHVIEKGNDQTTVFTEKGTEYRVEGVIASNPNRDLAILKLAEVPFQITVADISYGGEPRSLEAVYACGHPEGQEFSFSAGVVSRVVETDKLPAGPVSDFLFRQMGAPRDQIWIQHTAPIAHGNSGGPLLNEDYDIIGINTWVHTDANMGFASHIRYMQEMKNTSSDIATPFPAYEPPTRPTRRGFRNSQLQAPSLPGLAPAGTQELWTRADIPWWQNPYVFGQIRRAA